MKMKKLYKKIISIIFIVLTLLFVPLTGFIQGDNYFCYAVNQNILKESSSSLIPIIGYMVYSMNKQTSELISVDLSDSIEQATETYNKYFDNLSIAQKVYLGNAFTSYSLDEINHAYGSSYSQATVDSWGINDLKAKILNDETLTPYELQKLGITTLAAYQFKDSLRTNVITNHGVLLEGSIYSHLIGGYNFKIQHYDIAESLFDYVPGIVKGTRILALNKIGTNLFLSSVGEYFFNVNEQYYKLVFNYSLGYTTTTKVATDIFLNTATGENTGPYNQKAIQLFSMENGSWVSKYSTDTDSVAKKQALLNALGALLGINFSLTSIYNSGYGLKAHINVVEEYDNVVINNVQNIDKTVIAPTAGILTSAPDTSLSQAEQIISALEALGVNVQELTYSLSTYNNPDTNIEDVILTDPQGIGVDTGEIATDVPDTSGDTSVNPDGSGTLNIPILGTILSWLQKIWQMIKDLYDLILNHFMNPTSSDDGIDWGNFGGLFDLFFIFYYLIVIAILLLIKFLSVVMNILSIPPNTELFNSYPTMLDGLNYLKGLKIGGFTVTLQQIFEYMFMIFFFIFIVTTLQKLYHSFTGVERQELRANQKDIQIDRTSFYPTFSEMNVQQFDNYVQHKKDIYDSNQSSKKILKETDDYDLYMSSDDYYFYQGGKKK